MNSIIKINAVLLSCIWLQGCITHPEIEDSERIEIVVSSITEGASYDIVFHNVDSHFYYINRGLEKGLTLDMLRDSLLNKSVTLHLANTVIGTSNHIAQLSRENRIYYTEFD